ncbi:MAG: 6-phosphogluconolactonase [Caldilineaceae bacterium SB0675_bin_29]|uniref:6-phosphogluconolactonase n=1 Tax=Caldilineaceae bacterium SB0675_bin_29 TaxID=2605266 RepID=A0A6B1G954_9CHLR|nr:6-phosphogluconolactonase [Caldilineaceae bacterium SB0675_bin_29]
MTDTLPGTPSNRRGDTTGASEDLDRVKILGLSTAFPRSGGVIIQPGRPEFAVAAAGMVAAASMISTEQRGSFNVALAGGSTQSPVYELLAEDSEIDWQRSRIFWSDERCVPPEHSESNYRLVRETLLDRLQQAPGLVARMPGEIPPEQAARDYESTIREFVPADDTGIPRFDLILLGMGDDGHTASLFPGSQALNETDRLVAADFVTQIDSHRLTFTFPLINAGRHVLILVSGASKASTLKSVLLGPHQPNVFPVQGVQPAEGQFRWLVDADAAQCIQS